MKNSYIKQIFCGLLIGILVYSCENKQVATEQHFELPEKRLPNTIAFSQMQDSLVDLSDGLVSQILRYLKNFEGIAMKIATPLPESWSAEYKLTPMSSDFDIWIISNTNDVTHKILATVSTTQAPSIIQAIPIAYSAGIEKPNYIESEQWEAVVKEDYTVVVTKSYEKIYSLTDTANRHASTSSKIEDVYVIENNGKIHYKAPVSYTIDYRAIIQFADTASIGNILSEDWIWNYIDIQETVENVGILFLTATKNFNKLSIYNYHGEEVDVVDISPYIEKHNMGYLILEKGKKPVFAPYSSSKEFLPKAFKHFGLEYDADENENEEVELFSEK